MPQSRETTAYDLGTLRSDSETSSSENETLHSSSSASSSSSAAANSSDADNGGDNSDGDEDDYAPYAAETSRLPRKLVRLNAAVLKALRCVLSIAKQSSRSNDGGGGGSADRSTHSKARKGRKEAEDGFAKEPWLLLLRCLPDISAGLLKSQREIPWGTCKGLEVLVYLIETKVQPLLDCPVYMRKGINGRDARSARAFKKGWAALLPDLKQRIASSDARAFESMALSEQDETITTTDADFTEETVRIASVPDALLIRIAQHTLVDDAPERLNLSALRVEDGEVLCAKQIVAASEALGVNRMSITHVSLAKNGIRSLDPPGWYPWPFEHMTHLDVSHNPLDHLPVDIMLLQTVRIVSIRRTKIRMTEHGEAITTLARVLRHRHVAREYQCPSLLRLCIQMLMAYERLPDEVDSLPEGLSKLVRESYRCDICRKLCLPPWGWTDEGADNRGRWMRVAATATGPSKGPASPMQWMAAPVTVRWMVLTDEEEEVVALGPTIRKMMDNLVRVRGRICLNCCRGITGKWR